jgi:hypothetical protein
MHRVIRTIVVLIVVEPAVNQSIILTVVVFLPQRSVLILFGLFCLYRYELSLFLPTVLTAPLGQLAT